MTNTVEAGARRAQAYQIARWAVIGGLLLLPAVAMQVTKAVKWTLSDFMVMALLLGGSGIAYEVGRKVFRTPLARALCGCAVTSVAILIWVEAAVGIFH